MSQFNEILIQASYYLIVLIIGFGIIGILQKGFFWTYIRVRMSFGKYLLVKIRAINRDYFARGWIEDQDLIYKTSAGIKRINLEDSSGFYRALAVTWIDVEESSNNIISQDGEQIPGFDAVKYNNLYVRALTRPDLVDNKDRIMLAIVMILIVGIGILAFMIYKQGVTIQGLYDLVGSLNKGVLVAGG